MNQVSDKWTSILKTSAETGQGLANRFGQEAQEVLKQQAVQGQELLELGMKVQGQMMQEWLKSTQTLNEFWSEALSTFSKISTTNNSLKD